MTQRSFNKLRYGLMVIALGHFAQLVLYLLLTEFGGGAPLPDNFFVMTGFGVWQLTYVGPALLAAVVTRRWRPAAALAIGAFLTVLANVALWLLILAGGGNLVP